MSRIALNTRTIKSRIALLALVRSRSKALINPERKYVLARDRRHYSDWLRNNDMDSRECVYLWHPQQLHGLRFNFGNIVKLDGWCDNPSYNWEFMNILHERTMLCHQ